MKLEFNMNTIVVYPGRFQPFGPHHFRSYQWLCKVFGPDRVYIVTSDVVGLNSPLNFEEKRACIQKYNISANKIVKVKSPYRPTELLSRFDPNTTSIIFALGEKDSGRLNSNGDYFREFFGQKNLEPFEKHGYVLEIPNVNITFAGRHVNATFLREFIPTAKRNEFEELMGYYDPDIHFMLKKRLHPDVIESQSITESNSVTRTQLKRVEQYADKLFNKFGIDVEFQDLTKNTHFWQRINDPRNVTPITTDELRQIFRKASTTYASRISKARPGYEAVLKDMETDINLPFMIKFDRANNELDLVPKTIMRKKDFKAFKSSPILSMESLITTPYTKHIMHLYEDPAADVLGIAKILLQTPHDIDYVTVKYDGMNLKMTYKNGQFFAARNKGNIINPLTFEQMVAKYADKPNVQQVFKTAFEDMRSALETLGYTKLNSIFQGGKIFVNFEVYHPIAKNVYDYGMRPFISIHSLVAYNESGNQVHETSVIPEFSKLPPGSVYQIQTTPKFPLVPHDNKAEVDAILRWIESGEGLRDAVLYLENVIVRNFCKNNPQFDQSTDYIYDIINQSKQISGKSFSEILTSVEDMGGPNPIEGIVFNINGKNYKCTGSFGALVPIFSVYNAARFGKIKIDR